MTSDLRERLHDLADHAPTGDLRGADVWRSGVRRHRLRVAGAVAGSAAAVALVAGLVTVAPTPEQPDPAGQAGSLGIPRVVRPPDPWSDPTGTPGPLSAVSADLHAEPVGLTGSRSRIMLFGVSAVDGQSRWLDVPVQDAAGIAGEWVALSPDGTLLATTAYQPVGQRLRVRGWDLLDLRTGERTELRVPGTDTLPGGETYEISFSGDGDHLLTHFDPAGTAVRGAGALVAWDVESGEHRVVEGAGHRRLPGPATAPQGVAWVRGQRVLTRDPATGERGETDTAQDLVEATWSPTGGTLALIADESRGWRLRLDSYRGELVLGRAELGFEPGQLLGWRSDDQVVVSQYGPRRAAVVDVTTGRAAPLNTTFDSLMSPRYARDLWSRWIADLPVPDAEGDPRPWMHRWFQATAAGILLLGGSLVLVRRRRRG